MTEEQVRGFCLNNGINATPIGTALRVLDPTELPGSVRKFVNDDGTYKGDNTPEAEDSRHEESKGAPDADDTAVRKMPGDSLAEVEAKEEAIEGKELKGKLPEDFHGRVALEAAGITTYAQLRKAGDLTEIPGIGPATAEKIAEALREQ
jgi:hypothetical protein